MPIARPADVSIDSCNATIPTRHSRLLRCAATFVVLCLLALPRAHAEPAPTLLRAALIVKDATRSIDFYAQLGFRIESDTTSARNPRDNPFPLNAPATQTRLVIMANATGEGGRIGLVEFSNPTPPQVRSDTSKVGRGDVVLVFDVADADAVHARLRAANAAIIEPPQVYVSRRTTDDGRPMRGKVFHVQDPDGYLVELLQAPSP